MGMRVSKDKLAIAAEQNVKERDYWLNQLSGDWIKSTFPYDFPGAEVKEYRYHHLKFRFSPELFAKAVALSNGVDVKLHMIVVTGLFVLLDKYMNDDKDMMIGSPILKQDIEGEFINTVLVFKNPVRDYAGFKELLLQTREIIIKANENQNYPLEILLDRLDIPTREEEFPLFDVAILLENLHDRRCLEGIRYNMLFSFLKTAASIEGVVEYNSLLYRESTVKRIVHHYMHILEQALSNLNLKLSRVQMLSDQERQQILFDFNNTPADYPEEKTLHKLFENQTLKTPDNIVLVGNQTGHKTREISITYKELNKKSNRLAHLLNQKGVKPDTIAGIMVEPCLEMIIGILGILKAGGAYLPIDPDSPPGRIRYMLADSSVKILLAASAAQVKVKIKEESIQIIDISPLPSTSTSTLPSTCRVDPANLAYVIYTSGSTGKPKGVMVDHKNVTVYLQAFYREFNVNAMDTGIQLAPYSFDVFVEEVFPILLTGGRFIIPDASEMMHMDSLTRLIIKHRVTIIDCTPLLLNELNKLNPENDGTRDNPLKGYYIHTFISGGDVLKQEYIDRLLNIGKVYNTYGPTETTVCAAYYHFQAPALDWHDTSTGIPIGKPISNYNLYILDKNHQLVPVGVTGELFIGGPGVARGYLNNPELTSGRFLFYRSYRSYMPYISKKVYKTGDLARWLPDGNIQFLGRKDQQIKIRGFRVETGEIENRLLKHDEIKEAVVAAREDNRGDRFLCAYVVLNQEIELPGIRESLALELPHYMIPAFFVPLNQLPLTSNGKIDRNALPEPKILPGVEYVEPQNQAQKRLQTIWQEALVLEPIGINDNFFDIGGHSLKAIQVINRIHREFNVKIPLAEIFKTPTIHGLSQYIEQAARDQFVSLEPAEKREYYALSSAQKRLYLQQQMELNGTAYNMPAATTLNMKIEKGKPEQMFKILFQRHEILRTSFEVINRQPVQRIHPFHQLEFTIGYDESDEEQIYGRVENFLKPFDLSRAPLLRVGLIKTGEDEYVFMTDMHHIISDGVSIDILLNDFTRLYRGEELAPLRLQYKDFSRWQNSETQKELIKRQKLYWLTAFSGELPVLNLPTDYPRPLAQSFAGRITGFELGAEGTRALKKIALEEGVTLFILLLAAYNIFLAKISGQDDIIVGTSTASRCHPDLERIIGMFVNTLALRNYPRGDKTFKDFLNEVGERTIKAFENGDYPFEELVETVVKTRNISRSPIFDVRLTLNTIEHSAREMPEPEPPPTAGMSNSSKYDMTLYADDTGEKLEFNFQYCVKLFKQETIKRFSDYFKEIVSIIIKNKDIMLKDIKISHDYITVKSKAHQIDLDF